MALEQIKERYKDDPQALGRIEAYEQSSYGVGQEGNLSEDYAERMAKGQELRVGGGKVWWETGDGEDVVRAPDVEPAQPRRESTTRQTADTGYETAFKRAQDIVNPQVQSMMAQIDAAMLRAQKALPTELAARGQAVGGLREERERALTAEELLAREATVQEGAVRTAELAQDIYTEERAFTEQQRQFDEQMAAAMEARDYQKMRDLVMDERYAEQFEFEQEQTELANTLAERGIQLQESKFKQDTSHFWANYNLNREKFELDKDKAEEDKVLSSELMRQYEKYGPDITATVAQYGKEGAMWQITKMIEAGQIDQEVGDMFISNIYAEPEAAEEPKDIDSYIKSQFVKEGQAGKPDEISNPQSFLNYLKTNTDAGNISQAQAERYVDLYNISDKDYNKWLKSLQ